MVTADAVSEAADFVSDADTMQKGGGEAGNEQYTKSKRAANSSESAALPSSSGVLNGGRGT